MLPQAITLTSDEGHNGCWEHARSIHASNDARVPLAVPSSSCDDAKHLHFMRASPVAQEIRAVWAAQGQQARLMHPTLGLYWMEFKVHQPRLEATILLLIVTCRYDPSNTLISMGAGGTGVGGSTGLTGWCQTLDAFVAS